MYEQNHLLIPSLVASSLGRRGRGHFEQEFHFQRLGMLLSVPSLIGRYGSLQ
jgi:hypothetical protein